MTETPGALRSPPMASREPCRPLSSTPFQSSSGECRLKRPKIDCGINLPSRVTLRDASSLKLAFSEGISLLSETRNETSMMYLQRFLLVAALALPTAGLVIVSVPVGVVGLTAVSDSAVAQTCGPRPKKARTTVGECLRKAGAQWGRNPGTGNCSFWTRDRALSDRCGATWR